MHPVCVINLISACARVSDLFFSAYSFVFPISRVGSRLLTIFTVHLRCAPQWSVAMTITHGFNALIRTNLQHCCLGILIFTMPLLWYAISRPTSLNCLTGSVPIRAGGTRGLPNAIVYLRMQPVSFSHHFHYAGVLSAVLNTAIIIKLSCPRHGRCTAVIILLTVIHPAVLAVTLHGRLREDDPHLMYSYGLGRGVGNIRQCMPRTHPWHYRDPNARLAYIILSEMSAAVRGAPAAGPFTS